MSEVIGDRAFHAAPEAVGQLAVAYVHGMRDAGMAATAKHFPGHGAVVADSHLALPVDRRELADLSGDLAPYRRLIANGLAAVMVGARAVSGGRSGSGEPLGPLDSRRIARSSCGFRGRCSPTICPWEGRPPPTANVVTRARLALAAGCDMLPVCNDRASVTELLDHLEVGRCSRPRSLRLVRLRGRAAPDAAELLASAEWAGARARSGADCRRPRP